MKNVTSWERVPVLFDLKYAACLLGMSTCGLKALAQNGKVPAFKTGKLWRFEKESLHRWMNEQMTQSGD